MFHLTGYLKLKIKTLQFSWRIKRSEQKKKETSNNAAEVNIATRERSIPEIQIEDTAETVFINDQTTEYLIADVQNCSDIISVQFLIDGEPVGENAEYAGTEESGRYSTSVQLSDLPEGEHEVTVRIEYRDSSGVIQTIEKKSTITSSRYDCQNNGHIFDTFDNGYWVCSACESRFRDIGEASIELTEENVRLKNGVAEPEITVKDGDTVLTEGTDYEIEYRNNSSAGIGEIIVRGIGNYSGAVSRRFLIIDDSQSEVCTHEYVDVITPPTCTDAGYTTHACSRCGESVTDTPVEALGHSWDNGTVVIHSNCVEEGKIIYRCTVCGDTKIEEIPVSDHIWSDTYMEDTPATCSEEGSESLHCTVCGASNAESVRPVPKKPHTFGEWEIITAPSCSDGSKKRVCSECGAAETEVIPASGGHQWDAGKVTRKATTTAAGEKVYTCSVCKQTRKESIPKVTAPTGKVTILNTVANSAKKTNDVIWDKSAVKGATNYEINWRARGASKWASTKVGNVTRGVTSGLSIGGLYEIRVRPYKAATATSDAVYGAWSSSVYRYFHTTGKIRLASNSKGTFTMSWAKNSAATGYQVLYTTNKNGSGAAQNIKTAGASATSITVKDIKVNGKVQKLKSGTTYYVQVREIKKVGTITYIGNISCPVAVKVK